MKKFKAVLLAWMMIPVLAAAQDKVIVNDENAQRRTVGSFRQISVSGSIDLYLSPSDEEVVVVSARTPELRDKIVTRIQGDKLEIYVVDRNVWKVSDKRMKAYVSFRQLNEIKASGASDVFINGVVKSDALKIDISGASDFQGAIDAGTLDLHQSGSSDSKMSGRAGAAKVHLSGASDLKAFELATEVLEVHASGSSNVDMTVNKELFVHASGASDVRFKGPGVVKEVKTSGASSVKNVQ